jgi:LysM repeat protein
MSQSDSSDPQETMWRLRRRLWIERVVSLVLLVLLAVVGFGLLPGDRQATLVSADGQPVTVVPSERDARRLLEQVRLASGLPSDKVGFAQTVTFHSVAASRNPAQSDGDAMKALSETLDLVVTAAAILAQGQIVVGLPDQEQAVRTLSLVLRELSPRDVIAPPYFKENIKVEVRDVPADRFFSSAQEAVRALLDESAPKAEHEIVPGDSAWKLARDYGVSLGRLAAANPELDMDHLQVGQKLKIPGKLVPLTVVAYRDIELPSEGGEAGPRRVRITYENGAEVKREVIGRTARSQERLQPPPPSAPDDRWRWRDEIPE